MSEENCKHGNAAGACYICWHDLREERDRLVAELAELRQAHWDGRAQFGFDNDGDKTPEAVVSDFASLILSDWEAAAVDYNEALHDAPVPAAVTAGHDSPGLGDDVPCSKCGKRALDTGLECTECGHDMGPEIYPTPIQAQVPAAVPDDELHDAVGLDVAAGIESADYVSPRLRAELGTPSHLRDKLWSDCKTDRERGDFILSGRAFETGVIAHCIQAEVAMAFHRLALLSAAPVPAAVPDGYVLVPVEPTGEMFVVGGEVFFDQARTYGISGSTTQDQNCAASIYAAMLAAAQKKEES